jgi:hypothetical protein
MVCENPVASQLSDQAKRLSGAIRRQPSWQRSRTLPLRPRFQVLDYRSAGSPQCVCKCAQSPA